MRNQYNAITDAPAWVRDLIRQLEGVAFTTGIESNSKRTRGQAVNTDVYSFDDPRKLAVVQVRQFTWRNNRYPRIRKDYYLIGLIRCRASIVARRHSPTTAG